jgi:GGDEF domain-containing protein
MNGQVGNKSGVAGQKDAVPPEMLRTYDSLLDPVTELPGWVLLMDRTIVALSRARRMHRAVAVLVIEHPSAATDGEDGSANTLITRVRSRIRPDDTLASLEPGRYALLCPDLRAPSDADRIVDRLTQEFAGALANVTLNVAVASGDDDATQLLRSAARG